MRGTCTLFGFFLSNSSVNCNGQRPWFIKDTTDGTVYRGEAGTGAPLYSVYTYYNSTHAYNWTRCDTSMFGMEYVCMNNQEIDIRVVEEVNVSSVGQVALTDPECTLPSGISIWKTFRRNACYHLLSRHIN